MCILVFFLVFLIVSEFICLCKVLPYSVYSFFIILFLLWFLDFWMLGVIYVCVLLLLIRAYHIQSIIIASKVLLDMLISLYLAPLFILVLFFVLWELFSLWLVLFFSPGFVTALSPSSASLGLLFTYPQLPQLFLVTWFPYLQPMSFYTASSMYIQHSGCSVHFWFFPLLCI